MSTLQELIQGLTKPTQAMLQSESDVEFDEQQSLAQSKCDAIMQAFKGESTRRKNARITTEIDDVKRVYTCVDLALPSLKGKKPAAKLARLQERLAQSNKTEFNADGVEFGDFVVFQAALGALALRDMGMKDVTFSRNGTRLSSFPLRLRTLAIAGCAVGVDLAALAPLEELRLLSIHGCPLKGGLAGLGKKPHLVGLDIRGDRHNKLGRLTDLTDFTALQFLRLPKCGLTGSIYQLADRHPELREVDLSYNPLKGAVYDMGKSLSHLEVAIFFRCHLEQSIEESTVWLNSCPKFGVANMLNNKKGSGVHVDFKKRPDLQDPAKLMAALRVPEDEREAVGRQLADSPMKVDVAKVNGRSLTEGTFLESAGSGGGKGE
ncbi:hypothetical protein COB21_03910 [Candidatus Aerophobetes bacterium]|uniref:Leucine-rich repeat domain-containing protein n=1 Tax=Aerophobetes bacterium TaxID=2030807 RepID=A0A2A4X2B2_UNCAE|nr:MAG: hypothetical protein COB21_03910 [Candidatus Aerophobetes bacterium]